MAAPTPKALGSVGRCGVQRCRADGGNQGSNRERDIRKTFCMAPNDVEPPPPLEEAPMLPAHHYGSFHGNSPARV